MYRLTREVRLNLPLAAGPVDGGTGHAGMPAVDAPAVYWAVRVTLAGEPSPSGYLIDIKAIDAAVRERLAGTLLDTVRSGRRMADVVRLAFDALRDAWPGHRLDRVELATTPFQSYAVDAKEADVVRLSHHFEFSAAHRLHDPALSAEKNRTLFGKCNNPAGHGHNYEVRVTIAGRPGADGRLLPVAELERIVDEHAIGKVDHKHLNQQVPEFAGLNPSVENIAGVIYRWLKPHLTRETARLDAVTVWETPKTFCEYRESE